MKKVLMFLMKFKLPFDVKKFHQQKSAQIEQQIIYRWAIKDLQICKWKWKKI